MKLSKNINAYEMWVSHDHPDIIEAGRKLRPPVGLPEWAYPRLELLCFLCLQPIRDYFHRPVVILSGYRDLELNQAVNGYEKSDHMEAIAGDIFVESATQQEVYNWAQDNLPYRQLIFYPNHNFNHISINIPNKKPYKHESWVTRR